jgi:hypothetical protein
MDLNHKGVELTSSREKKIRLDVLTLDIHLRRYHYGLLIYIRSSERGSWKAPIIKTALVLSC